MKRCICKMSLLVTALFALLSSCGNPGNDLPDPGTDPGVVTYRLIISGSIGGLEVETQKPCYWNNGSISLLSLPSSKSYGCATGACIINNKVWYSGCSCSSGVSTPCYWENGTYSELPMPTDSNSFGVGFNIGHKDNAVYIVGYTRNSSSVSIPCYWLNGTYTKLEMPTTAGMAHNQFINGDDTYFVGYCIDSRTIPCYWKNGEYNPLPFPDYSQKGEAVGITANNNGLYICGYYQAPAGYYLPCYWNNGAHHTLSVPADIKRGDATAILNNEGKIIIAGQVRNALEDVSPCYWVDGEYKSLPVPDGTTIITIWSIAVKESKTIITGAAVMSDESSIPCYWEDGIFKALSMPADATSGIACSVNIQ